MPEFDFEPLRVEHLPQLQAWLSQPHVARWWGGACTMEQVLADYLPSIEGHDPSFRYIARRDERLIGMVQWYLWSSYPGPREDGDIGIEPGEAGLDYLIGEPDLIGNGLGPRMLTQFLERFVLRDLSVSGVRTSVHAENRRSWRALQKIGFELGEPLEHPAGHLQYAPVLRRSRPEGLSHPEPATPV